MRTRLIIYAAIIGIIIIVIMTLQHTKPVKSLMPHLPFPIAEEKVMVTPAGQGPEALIVAELCDVLNIRNNFLYWAEPKDLVGNKALIVVLGFSKQGLYSMHKTPEEETTRVISLVEEAEKMEIPVILVHLGGQDRRDSTNDNLAQSIASSLEYIIVTEEGEEDKFFTKLARDYNFPITVVSDIESLNVPLNSVFR